MTARGRTPTVGLVIERRRAAGRKDRPKMRKLITIAACALAAITLPAVAAGGAIQFAESWTDEPTFFYMGEFACTGQPTTVAGHGLSSGSVRVTETTSPEGAHVRLAIDGRVDLYAASGPPWDVQLGSYVGTWTYRNQQVEEYNPGGTAALSGASHGEIVFADGNTARLKISFTLVLDREDGPQLFFAKAACGGE
jgi:hypothetical protein